MLVTVFSACLWPDKKLIAESETDLVFRYIVEAIDSAEWLMDAQCLPLICKTRLKHSNTRWQVTSQTNIDSVHYDWYTATHTGDFFQVMDTNYLGSASLFGRGISLLISKVKIYSFSCIYEICFESMHESNQLFFFLIILMDYVLLGCTNYLGSKICKQFVLMVCQFPS